jgi:hypothetical protein
MPGKGSCEGHDVVGERALLEPLDDGLPQHASELGVGAATGDDPDAALARRERFGQLEGEVLAGLGAIQAMEIELAIDLDLTLAQALEVSPIDSAGEACDLLAFALDAEH